MDFVGIDWSNPLILLRLYLTGIWLLPVLYGAKVLRGFPSGSPFRPLIWLSVAASFMGATSYFVGASTTFTSPIHFVWIAGLLGFTPLSMLAWFFITQAHERKKKRGPR